MEKRFQRRIENFTCRNCEAAVTGDGYTNHCPECLWSQHVDVNPGDRAEKCSGLMEPIQVTQKQGNYILNHRCTKCGIEKRNRTSKSDKFDALLSIIKG